MRRLVCVLGARPNFIKAAPFFEALKAYRRRLRCVMVHTGQHYDVRLSEVFFKELQLPSPDVHLGIGSGTQGAQTGRMLEALEPVLQKARPDGVVVFGDVNSTLAGALAAAKLHLPLVHVEAGLRSFNRRMPEEINRVVVDHVSAVLFCPTQTAVRNLQAEGIRRGVHLVGDPMVDALRLYGRLTRPQRVLQQLQLTPQGYALATIHRAENTDDPKRLQALFAGLAASRLPVVIPLHPRTRARLAVGRRLPKAPSLRFIEPVSYLEMLALEQHARLILTDSGGVQKEAYCFGVPCVTLREETEWVETVQAGGNRLVGANTGKIAALLRHPPTARSRWPAVFGDGHSCERMARLLLRA
jgi:UDP-N-acetylglucosamine 2-epimerase